MQRHQGSLSSIIFSPSDLPTGSRRPADERGNAMELPFWKVASTFVMLEEFHAVDWQVSAELINWSALMERSSQMISFMIARHLQIIRARSVGVGRWSEARSAVMSAIGGAISQLSTNDISGNYRNADQGGNYPRSGDGRHLLSRH